jgi:hypothetical protein
MTATCFGFLLKAIFRLGLRGFLIYNGSLDEHVEYYWSVCGVYTCRSLASCIIFNIDLALICTWNLYGTRNFIVTWNLSLDSILEYVELEHSNIHIVQYSWRPTHIKHTHHIHSNNIQHIHLMIHRERYYISAYCNNTDKTLHLNTMQ